MQIRPLHDKVLIKRLEDTTTHHGSIIIPDSAKEKPQQGEVKGVGSGKLSETGERFPPEVKVEIASCLASIPAPKSRWMERNI